MPKIVVWVPLNKQGYTKALVDVPLSSCGGEEKAVNFKSLSFSGQEFVTSKLLSNNRFIEVTVASVLEYDQTHDHCLSDLSTLWGVNDAAVLNSIYGRFKRGKFNSFISPALHISVHPCCSGPDVSGSQDDIHRYEKLAVKEKRAHLFHMLDRCLSSRLSLDFNHNSKSDSIVVIGRAASGKTQATRRLLRYALNRQSFTDINSNNTDTDTCGSSSPGFACSFSSSVADRARCMTTLLDAFGNASTPANDDSSRYSSVLSLSLQAGGEPTDDGFICRNTSLFVFGLEIARLVSASAGEDSADNGGRNFHVLHQMINGLEKSDLSRLLLTSNPTQYRYLGRRCAVTNATAVSLQQIVRRDAHQFRGVRAALAQITMHLVPALRDPSFEVLRLLAGILHIGNLLFRSKHDGLTIEDIEDNQAPCEIVKSKYFYFVEEVLGVGSDSVRTGGATFEQVLTSKTTSVTSSGRSSLFTVELTARQTTQMASALAMELYARMFQWIASKWSDSGGDQGGGSSRKHIVNIVDLCSFELGTSSAHDSFHMFLSNYGNEKLRSQYMSDLFSSELRLYKEDNLPVPELCDGSHVDNRALWLLDSSGDQCNGSSRSSSDVFSVLEHSCDTNTKGDTQGPAAAAHFVNALFSKLSAAEALLTPESRNTNHSSQNQSQSHGSPDRPKYSQRVAWDSDHTGGGGASVFGVRHFAGDVFYDAEGFLSSNITGNYAHATNKPLKLLVDMLARSTNPLVREIFAGAETVPVAEEASMSRRSHEVRPIVPSATATRRLSMAVRANKHLDSNASTKNSSGTVSVSVSGSADKTTSDVGGYLKPLPLGDNQAGRYRRALDLVLKTLRDSRSVQYLLCIKPNWEYFEPEVAGALAISTADTVVFDRELVLQQLRQYSVSAYAQLRSDRSGCYPIRQTYSEVHNTLVSMDLYAGSGLHVLARTGLSYGFANDVQCRKWVILLFEKALDPECWRDGHEHVWMKSTVFQSLRLYKQRNLIITLQRIWRGVLVRLKLYKYVSGIIALQRQVRRRQFCRRYEHGIHCGVVKIQALVRMYHILKKVLSLRQEILREKSALQLQRMYRMYRAQMRVVLLLQYRSVAWVFNRWRLKRRLRFRSAIALIKAALMRQGWRDKFIRVISAARVINRLGSARSCRLSFLKLRRSVLRVQQLWRGFYIRKQAPAIVELIKLEHVLRRELISAVVWNDLARLKALFNDPLYATVLQRGEVDAGTREKDCLGGSPLIHLAVDNCHKMAVLYSDQKKASQDPLSVLRYLLEMHRESVDSAAVDCLGRTVFHRLVADQYSGSGGSGGGALADMALWTYLLRVVPSEVLLMEDIHGTTVLQSLEAEQRRASPAMKMPPTEYATLLRLVTHYVEEQPVRHREARLVRHSWYVTSRFAVQNQGKARQVHAHEYKSAFFKPFQPASKLPKKAVGAATVTPHMATSKHSFVTSAGFHAYSSTLIPPINSSAATAPPQTAASWQCSSAVSTTGIVSPALKVTVKSKSKRKSLFAWANTSTDATADATSVTPTDVDSDDQAPTVPPIIPPAAREPEVSSSPAFDSSSPSPARRTSNINSILFGTVSGSDEDNASGEESGGFFTSRPFEFACPACESAGSKSQSNNCVNPTSKAVESVERALQDVVVGSEDLQQESAEVLRARREERHRRMRAARDAGAVAKKALAMGRGSEGSRGHRVVEEDDAVSGITGAQTSIPFTSVYLEDSVKQQQRRSILHRSRVVRKHEEGYHPMLDVFSARDCE